MAFEVACEHVGFRVHGRYLSKFQKFFLNEIVENCPRDVLGIQEIESSQNSRNNKPQDRRSVSNPLIKEKTITFDIQILLITKTDSKIKK